MHAVFNRLAALAWVAAASATPAASDPQADLAWQALQTKMTAMQITNADRLTEVKQREEAKRQFRDLGLAFYTRYPEDQRRWQWLLETVKTEPRYFLKAEQAAFTLTWNAELAVQVDDAALAAWNKRLQRELMPAFLASPQTTSEQRLELYSADLTNKSFHIDRRAYQRKPVDLEAYRRQILAVAKAFPQDPTASGHAGHFFEFGKGWGMTDEGLRAFANAMAASPNEALRELGLGKRYLFSLLDDPDARLDMTLETLDGKTLRLSDLRGKMVMIDFWSLSCSACLDEMPHIREVYERYRGQGFDVVSVAFNEESEKAKVAALMKKLGLRWSTALQSPDAPDSSWKRFGFTALGEQFLVDRQGRLVANVLNDVSKLEPRIRELLPP